MLDKRLMVDIGDSSRSLLFLTLALRHKVSKPKVLAVSGRMYMGNKQERLRKKGKNREKLISVCSSIKQKRAKATIIVNI